MDESNHSQQRKIGLAYGVLAFSAWGVLPLYWKLLEQIPAGQILAHRIVWSFFFVAAILAMGKKWLIFKEVLTSPKKVALIALCSVIISVNWFTYIYAVNTHQVVEASLGYYINPLVSVIFGLAFLKEKLSQAQWVAVLMAAIGVVVMTVQYGKIPLIAMTLAISFAIYGLLKKLIKVDSVASLALETAVLVPIALLYLGYKQIAGVGAIGVIPGSILLLLIASGVATAAPLLWFAKGAQRIELSTIGFLQYLAPTISLGIGIFIFNEPFSKTHLISFGFIWIAIIVYTLSKTGIFKDKDRSYQSKEATL
ncbi:MAG: EamA family transporter RarD [Bacillota bacterium]|nr:EamA family transporter RarD [Bacillota bacterium]